MTRDLAATSIACELCDTELALRFPQVVDSLSGDAFQILACPRCRHGRTWPVPADLARYYGARYHGGRHSLTGSYCARRRLRFATQMSPPTAGRRLLDLGCGDGTFLLSARQAGWQVAGTEMNGAIARQAGVEVYSSLDELPAATAFECVTLWHVLEHLADPLAELERIGAVLAPGGVLIVAVPNAGSAQARLWGRDWLHLDVPRHLHHFSRDSLEQYLAKAGFAIERRWSGEFEYDLFGWAQSALNRLLPEPNLFFAILTRRATERGRLSRWFHGLLGTAFCGLAMPPTICEMHCGNPGTLVVAARRKE